MAGRPGRGLGEMVVLDVVTSPSLWRIEVDPNELEAAILNLAVNARDAMPTGGSLTIETANALIGEAYSALHAEIAPGSSVVISVTEPVNGLSKAMHAPASDPLFHTQELGPGTEPGTSPAHGSQP